MSGERGERGAGSGVSGDRAREKAESVRLGLSEREGQRSICILYPIQVNENSDIYNFDMVILEIVLGKRLIDPEYVHREGFGQVACKARGSDLSLHFKILNLSSPSLSRRGLTISSHVISPSALTVSPSASPSSRHHLAVSIVCLSLQNNPSSPPSRRLALASLHHLDLPLPLALAVSHSQVPPSRSASPSSSRRLALTSGHHGTACAASASPTVRPLPPAVQLLPSRSRLVGRRRRSPTTAVTPLQSATALEMGQNGQNRSRIVVADWRGVTAMTCNSASPLDRARVRQLELDRARRERSHSRARRRERRLASARRRELEGEADPDGGDWRARDGEMVVTVDCSGGRARRWRQRDGGEADGETVKADGEMA
ncbi:hypothetical protein Syun_007927 [Stephania yunnanensis]|uniref:Uncharacterized protein n=1 Tax=Stephania yunnanensis TaxID=152371 RepID=A0AAP0KZH1_9MAGN